ncbi:MAG: VTT domain-containing protein [Hyphomicrobiaceae bacterium]|nr:VTT domain-containing protein [Hyphomicrobiaceae bacterium]
MDDEEHQPSFSVGRWLPLLMLLAAMAAAFGMGWHSYLTFKTIGLNHESLKSFIEANKALALLLYVLGYAAVVALSLPGALVMTVAGGLLFGWQLAAPATAIAATVGATIVFSIARTSLGEPLAAKAGPWLGRLREGFQGNALSYLLFLRLVPAFPFFVVNLAPALLGVPLRTYVIATFLGIIPGTLAFSVAGSGLASVIEAQNRLYMACLARTPAASEADCPYTVDTSALLTPELVAAFVLLGVVALIPVAVRKWSKRHAEA